MSAVAPRNVALTDQVRATLAGEGCLPISTMALWEKISPYRPRAERLAAEARGEFVPPQVPYAAVLRILNRLARLGDVEKLTVPDMRCRYWRLR